MKQGFLTRRLASDGSPDGGALRQASFTEITLGEELVSVAVVRKSVGATDDDGRGSSSKTSLHDELIFVLFSSFGVVE